MKPVRQIRVGITLLVRKGAQSVWENGIFQNVFFLAQTLSASPHIAQASIVCCGDGKAADRARFMADSPVPCSVEQQALRQEYLADIKASLRSQLERTSIQEPDGTIHKVTRRTDAKKPRS